MKCVKILALLYVLVIIAAITLVACSKKNIEYVFDISKPDYSSELKADSIDRLFKMGIVVKTFKNHNYYIHNAHEHIDSIDGREVLDFGPITFEKRFDRANYKLSRVDTTDITKCLLELPLVSKFEGGIKKVEIEPAWLKFSMYDGLFNVNILPSLTFKFDEELNKGDRFLVEIPWTMNSIDSTIPVLVSIKIYCYTTDEDYFTEAINLEFSNNRK